MTSGGIIQQAYLHAHAGDPQQALHLIDRKIAWVQETGAHESESELFRYRGELLLQTGHDETLAEASFQQSLEKARRQEAKSWELLAAMSMSRLWARQGKREQAHELLAGVYNWFTEGFDTRDLRDAKALLDELAP